MSVVEKVLSKRFDENVEILRHNIKEGSPFQRKGMIEDLIQENLDILQALEKLELCEK